MNKREWVISLMGYEPKTEKQLIGFNSLMHMSLDQILECKEIAMEIEKAFGGK